MKLVIDLQGAQSKSRHRGIGRYSLALARAVARAASTHDVWIALNGAFSDAIEPIRVAFDTLIPQERIVVWEAPTPVRALDPDNDWRRRTGVILRESFLRSLEPDMVHVSSLFEGLDDDTISSVGAFTDGETTAITLYDLIPFIYPDLYLPSSLTKGWYHRKIGHMRRAGLWLAISESSRREGIDWLNLPPNKVVNISTAADAQFRPVRLGEDEERAVRQRYGLSRPFVMHAGILEQRKNVEGLINAYARLPAAVRSEHQLAIVCSANEQQIRDLTQLALHRGLAPDELVTIGFVPDRDLLALYNLCTAFCFPSWHEGFGLPALEAMQCGAATIGANTSSVPEVIGRADALFDPHDENDMAARLHQVLTDSDYRRSLKEHGLRQARKFSWEESARRAWAAFEAHNEEAGQQARYTARPARRPRLAFVSPLPPERSGIADYSAELLPELARHYDIDVIIDQQEVSDSWIKANCPIRDVTWFSRHAQRYDRILYQFGNSTLHRHMFDLINRYPGIVVLHDFYLSNIIAHIELHDGRNGFWRDALYRSHGYQPIFESYTAQNPHDIIWKYPANLPVLQNAAGIIVHSEYARHLAQGFYGKGFAEDWAVIQSIRSLPIGSRRQSARKELGYEDGDFVVCSFGLTGPIKLSHRLIQAWLSSKLAGMSNCHLVLVGGVDESEYGKELQTMISKSGARERIRVTGFVAPELYEHYLSSADAAVQLRTSSRGETSRAVLDCLAHGVPTIVNAHGAMVELPEHCVVMLPDQFSNADLAAALEELRADGERRQALGSQGQAYVKEKMSPRRIADQYYSAIERQSAHGRDGLTQRTMTELAEVEPLNTNEADWLSLARTMNKNLLRPTPKRQLLVDVSALVHHDLRTGIQRVTRGILAEMLANPPSGYRVEPVYATAGRPGYQYARKFTMRFLGCPEILPDSPVELKNGDVFLGLDLHAQIVPEQVDFFSEMRRIGGEVYFIIYDLLPLRMPYAFIDVLPGLFSRWFRTISAHADGVIGISRTVAEDYMKWADANAAGRLRPLKVGWFHLGADTDRTLPTKGAPDDSENIFASLAVRPSFLMVGTVEPRKKHEQVIAAFEKLWAEGGDANLVTPFGHAGQEALHSRMMSAQPDGGGFEHNFQSLRVVDRLEERYAAFDGLNLSFETREGVLKHCSRRNAQWLVAHDPTGVGRRFIDRSEPSLEAQLCNLADEIAYNAHDIDDGVRSRLLSLEQLEGLALPKGCLQQVRVEYPALTGRRVLFESLRRMLSWQVYDVIDSTRQALSDQAVHSADEARRLPALVRFSPEMRSLTDEVQRFLRANLYRHPQVAATTGLARTVLQELFDLYVDDPSQMHAQQLGGRSVERAVSDYIAGMTDRFALQEHARLTGRPIEWPARLRAAD